MSSSSSCFTGIHTLRQILYNGMLCRWTCIAERHVVVVVLSFMRISVVGGHV